MLDAGMVGLLAVVAALGFLGVVAELVAIVLVLYQLRLDIHELTNVIREAKGEAQANQSGESAKGEG